MVLKLMGAAGRFGECVNRLRVHPEGERAPVNQGAVVVLRPVDDGVKRFAHEADTKGDLGDQIPRDVKGSIRVGNNAISVVKIRWGQIQREAQ